MPGLRFRRIFGVSDEWHLVFLNAVLDITFRLVSWFHESIIGFGPAFFSPRFKPIRSIGDSVGCDGIEQLLVEMDAEGRVVLALESNHGLEGFERLDRTLEAD